MPAATVVPAGYATLRPGAERKRQTQLDWWARFQLADGWLPATARVLVAGGIVATVLGLGGSVGGASVTVYNGLARAVTVKVGAHPPVTLSAYGHWTREIAADKTLHLEAHSLEGQLIESFDTEASGSFGQFIYNVAGASPLVEWTATYGNASAQPERPLGAPRWTSSSASVVFVEPPTSISTKGGGGTREVISALADTSPGEQLGMIAEPAEGQRIAALHARWDALTSPHLAEWMWAAKDAPGFAALLKARLAESPTTCCTCAAQAPPASEARPIRQHTDAPRLHRPTQPVLHHHACLRMAPTRTAPSSTVSRATPTTAGTPTPRPTSPAATRSGCRRSPPPRWRGASCRRWPMRWRSTSRACAACPAQDDGAAMNELAKGSPALRQLLALESGQGIDAPALKAYAELARGRLDAAVELSQNRPQTAARLLRLAAASNGANPALVARALALPADKGLDDGTLWASLRTGAARRAGHGPVRRAGASHGAAARRGDAAFRRRAAPRRAGRTRPSA